MAQTGFAKAQGLKSYFTGKPCPQGHLAERYTANGTCVQCNKVKADKWTRANGLRRKQSSRCSWLERKYGITEQDFIAFLARQDNKCAICETDSPPIYGALKQRGGWQIDHDHKTGAVRGILCSPCNRALGAFRDDTNRMLQAIKYLTK